MRRRLVRTSCVSAWCGFGAGLHLLRQIALTARPKIAGHLRIGRQMNAGKSMHRQTRACCHYVYLAGRLCREPQMWSAGQWAANVVCRSRASSRNSHEGRGRPVPSTGVERSYWLSCSAAASRRAHHRSPELCAANGMQPSGQLVKPEQHRKRWT